MQDPYFVVTVMTDEHDGRCWALPVRVGRREGMGSGGAEGEGEIKQFAGEMSARGSAGLCASPPLGLH